MKNAGNARMRVRVGHSKNARHLINKLHAVTAPVPRRGFHFNGVAGNRQVSWLPSVLSAPSQEPLPALQVAYAGRCRPSPHLRAGHPVTVAGPQRIRTALPY